MNSKLVEMSLRSSDTNLDAGNDNYDDTESGTECLSVTIGVARNGCLYNSKSLAADVCDLRTSKFKRILGKAAFVDKTLFIRLLFENIFHKIMVTAPHHFGKSTNMDMVKIFSSVQIDEDAKPISNPEDGENYKLFQSHSLKIYTEEREFFRLNCGQYPVISLSFKEVTGTSFEEVLRSLAYVIHKAFKEHSYLVKETVDGQWVWKNKALHQHKLTSIECFLDFLDKRRLEKLTETQVNRGLFILSQVLCIHFNKKVVVLVDDYDIPILNVMRDNNLKNTINIVLCCIRSVIEFLVTRNYHLKRVLLNGSVSLTGAFVPRRIKFYRFLHDHTFYTSFGFTGEEVRDLLKKPLFRAYKQKDIADWYGGYRVVHNDQMVIYNSWSVLNFLQKSVESGEPSFDIYWSDTGYIQHLITFLRSEGKKEMWNLLYDKNVPMWLFSIDTNSTLDLLSYNLSYNLEKKYIRCFLILLLESGYLNADCRNIKFPKAPVLKIPNIEIRKSLLIMFLPQLFSKITLNFPLTSQQCRMR